MSEWKAEEEIIIIVSWIVTLAFSLVRIVYNLGDISDFGWFEFHLFGVSPKALSGPDF